MSRLQLRGVNLAYSEAGDGTPVTLLHGFAQRGAIWDDLRPHLRSRHRWITVDLRGHGETHAAVGAACTLEACAEDVIALWDSLGIERSHLAGYSMGGRLALALAAAFPERVRSLAVISAHGGLDEAERISRRAADKALATRIEAEGTRWFAEHWASLPMFRSLRQRRPDLSPALTAMRLGADPRGLAASLRGMGAAAMQPLWDVLPRVHCPALLVAGAEDARFVAFATRLAAVLPDAELRVVPDAGHAVHLEQPAATATLLDGFLTRAEGMRDG